MVIVVCVNSHDWMDLPHAYALTMRSYIGMSQLNAFYFWTMLQIIPITLKITLNYACQLKLYFLW